MSTYTPSLGLEEISPGDQAGLWGNTTNNNLFNIDYAIAGVAPIDLTGYSGYTRILTFYNGAPDESRAAVINVIGTATGANIVQIPLVTKLYVFRNSSGQDITVQTVTAANSVTIKSGEATLVFCDGLNAYAGIATAGVGTLTVSLGGTGATSFGAGGVVKSSGGTNALTASAVSIASGSTDITGTLPVVSGGTGKTTFNSGELLIGNGTGNLGTLNGGTAGWVATWNGSSWSAQAPSAAGVTSVNGLTGAVTLNYSNVGAPSTTGSGASGTWSINISGSAASATSASTASTATYATSAGSATTATSATTASSATTATTASTANALNTSNNYTGGAFTSTAGLAGDSYGFYLGSSSAGMNYGSGAVSIGFRGSNGLIFNSSSSADFTLSNVTKPGGGSFNVPSDASLKTDIAQYTLGLSAIKQIDTVTFKYVGPLAERTKNKTFVGVIAQQLEQTAFADCVSLATDGTRSVDSSAFVYALINAVKELSAEVDALKAKLA